jgi:hypothetical protein
LDGTVFAIAVDKHAPFSLTYLANTARDAVVGQAKNRSPVHLLTRSQTRPHEMFRRGAAGSIGVGVSVPHRRGHAML